MTGICFSCGVHVVGSLLYLLAGSDQVQAWAAITNNKTEEEHVETEANNKGQTNLGYYRSFDEAELEHVKR
jgi:hypothetical protein